MVGKEEQKTNSKMTDLNTTSVTTFNAKWVKFFE